MKQEYELEPVNSSNMNKNPNLNVPRVTNSEIVAQFQRARQTMHNMAEADKSRR